MHIDDPIHRLTGAILMRRMHLDPDPWQADVLECGHPRNLLNCARQAGKSTTVAFLALAEALFRARFSHLKETVLPDWARNAENERRFAGKTSGEHQNRLEHWWLLKRRRGELIAGIEGLARYIVRAAPGRKDLRTLAA
jgi:hypothetical protein